MTQRLRVAQVAPEGYRAISRLERYARDHVEHSLYELVKLRASMLNGCAFCVDMHSTDALAAGEDVRRLFSVAAWREAEWFTPAERAALALTDEVTRLGEHGVSDDTWDAARKEFDEPALANLLIAIATINVWNRISVSTRTPPPPLTS